MSDDKYAEILAKLTIIWEDVNQIKIATATQAKDISRNADDLQTHMKRTAQLEARMTPVEKHINMWAGVGKFVTIAAVVLGVAFTLSKLN